MANTTLTEAGWGPQLLCSVFGFVPEPGAASDARPFSLVYLYKRGTFYPFAPVDNAEGAPGHRARAAHPHHAGGRPPGRVRPGPLVPHVGPPGRMTVTRRAPHRARGGGELPRPRRLRHRRRAAHPLAGAVPGRRPERADRDRPRRHARARHPHGGRPALGPRGGAEPLRRGGAPGDLPPLPLHQGPPQRGGLRPGARVPRRPVHARCSTTPRPQIVGGAVRSWPPRTPARPSSTARPGKDRTGLLSALVLSLLGVPEETVVADYALSGAAMAPPPGQVDRRSTPTARASSPTPTSCSRPTRPTWSPSSPTCGTATGPWPSTPLGGRVCPTTWCAGCASRCWSPPTSRLGEPARLSAAGASGRWRPPGPGRAR